MQVQIVGTQRIHVLTYPPFDFFHALHLSVLRAYVRSEYEQERDGGIPNCVAELLAKHYQHLIKLDRTIGLNRMLLSIGGLTMNVT